MARYNKVKNINTQVESVVTEEVYKTYQKEFIILKEDVDPNEGLREQKVAKIKAGTKRRVAKKPASKTSSKTKDK